MMHRWRPSPAIRASFALHAGAATAVLLEPTFWPGSIGAIVANHGLLTAAGLWPRSSLLGPNLTRLPPAAAARKEVALTFDDGPDPHVTPQVLKLLDAAGMCASFFCIGSEVLRHPALAREIVAAGHLIENHSQHHFKLFAALGPRRMREEIVRAQDSIASVVGRVPQFFRPTAGLRNPFLDPILSGLGLQLATWTRRPFDSRCTDPSLVHARLAKNLAAGDILLMHDGLGASAATGRPVILEALPRLIDTLRNAGLHSVTLSAAITEPQS